MPRLFSYCIPYDNGAAPNPFWGVCTLNICKPVIRRNAKKGDWVVGTGSSQYGFDNEVVYAMEITETMTMQQYEKYCNAELSKKIPNWGGESYKERVGDCIYEFSVDPAKILKSVHNEDNRQTDLNGEFMLLSDHFYYFGERPEPLPDHLLPIVRQGQGHKSTANQRYFHDFIDWILTQGKAKNKVYSEPHDRHLFTLDCDYINQCASRDKQFDDMDEKIEGE
ncbi:Nmad2 family putative nucleotide modification protein [Pleomorphovibrio marinus]|uniref:Nmad2 family putative nucleotide modification protein n=1 Tax=Pleomorphovibrio marinus TaxID=2164132 RepID=UPI000E0B5D7F|nr:hypothetical protein [Pleomorphovibrio marinus]